MGMIIAISKTSLLLILLIVVAVVEVVVAAAAVAVVVAAVCSLFLSIPELFLCQKKTRPILYFKLGI